jgi:pimeloyl-ACP methyl ester carboxylesterase
VVVAYALSHPVRVAGLVLVSPLPTNSLATPREARPPDPAALALVDQLEADDGRQRDPEALSRAWRAAYLPTQLGNPDAADRVTDTSGLPNEYPWHAAQGLVAVLGDLGPYDWRPLLRDLQVPMLVVAGTAEQEPIEHAAEWADLAGAGRFLELEGVGRHPWAEAPEVFFTTVGRFVNGESV